MNTDIGDDLVDAPVPSLLLASREMENQLEVTLVGLGFGSCFAEIYLRHPDVAHSLSWMPVLAGFDDAFAAARRGSASQFLRACQARPSR